MKENTATKTETEVLELDYQLVELPSSQHRAGLAGLVLIVKWLRQHDNNGICEISRLDSNGATLRINLQGLKELFNEVYAASHEEQPSNTIRKNKAKQVIPPIREESITEIDTKTGKSKQKTVYFYEATIPKGAFLVADDPTANNGNGIWVKLWRDMVWSILRGVPATRGPFEARANKDDTDDAIDAWQKLLKSHDSVVDLPSTYFIGAQANNAENVPFKDRARMQFLLHFWPFVTQVYVPAVINNEDKREFVGYALAIPDVCDLEIFCEELRQILNGRGTEVSGYRPRDAVVDLAIESGLDLMRRLRERLMQIEGERSIADLILGIDVLHVEKQGNNVRLLSSFRMDPEADVIDRYAQFRNSCWNPTFRKQRLINLVNNREWFDGFDSVLSRQPYAQTIGNNYFRRDARTSFLSEVKNMSENVNDIVETSEVEGGAIFDRSDDQSLIYRVIGNYLRRKLKSKEDLTWESVKGNSQKEEEYKKKKRKLAREAFLAVRSRTGGDFVEYFTSSICSVSQSMSEQQYAILTKSLFGDTDKARTLTMLALAAQTPAPQSSNNQNVQQ